MLKWFNTLEHKYKEKSWDSSITTSSICKLYRTTWINSFLSSFLPDQQLKLIWDPERRPTIYCHVSLLQENWLVQRQEKYLNEQLDDKDFGNRGQEEWKDNQIFTADHCSSTFLYAVVRKFRLPKTEFFRFLADTNILKVAPRDGAVYQMPWHISVDTHLRCPDLSISLTILQHFSEKAIRVRKFSWILVHRSLHWFLTQYQDKYKASFVISMVVNNWIQQI